MAEGSGFVDNKRKLGYSLVKWNIENFCLATCRDGYVIHSPEFYVIGAEVTKWRINLIPNPEVTGPYVVSLNLERLEYNPGPDRVRVNWKFGLQNKEGNEICETRGEYTKPFGSNFGKEYSHPVDMERVDIINNKLLPFESDALIVECRVIVHVEQLRMKTENSTLEIGSLSEDLKNLFTRIDDDRVPDSSTKSDVTIEFENEYIKAHSVILHSRNAVFQRLLNGERKTTIQIDSMNYVLTKQLVSYLYSGNMDFVLKNPSIQLFDFMKDFEAECILNNYQPDLFTLTTVIDAIDERFLWTITDFQSRNEYYIQSPVLRKGTSGISWQLMVYPKGRNRDGSYVSIVAQCIESRQQQDICLEFIVLDQNQRLAIAARLPKRIRCRDVLKDDKFAETRLLFLLPSLVEKDMLHIIFRVRIASGKENHSSVVHTSSVFSNVTDKPYDTLSLDIERMLCDNCFKDMDLVVEEKHQSYHKCILAARSKYFLKLFEREVDIVSAPISNIDLRTFNILMSYIYSGRLKCDAILGDTISLSQLYDAAQVFDISRFNGDFIKFCQTNLGVKNVCAILLFAEEKDITELKHSAFQFISLNLNAVQSEYSWAYLRQSKPYLISEISELLTMPVII